MSAGLPPQAPRCWVEQDLTPGTVSLAPAEQRHLQNVRRVRAGDSVCVLNGVGQIGTGRLNSNGSIELSSVEEVPRPHPELQLVMGAVKQTAWEEILRHATELGVSRILRVESGHAVSKLGGKADKKAVRWRELLVEACKQSANPWLPELRLMSSVTEVIRDGALPSVALVAQLEEGAVPVGEALQEGLAESIAVWVGPEGDFTSAEYKMIRESGARPVTLGPRVLRSETAALSLLSRLRLNG